MLHADGLVPEFTIYFATQLSNAVKYTNYITAEEYDSPAPNNKCPAFDIKQSAGKAPVMLELWGMQSAHSLLLLPGPL